jgi:hypothetical protein
MYEAASICGFEATIDGQRTVKGIAKEAKQAAKEYHDAIQVSNEQQLDRSCWMIAQISRCIIMACSKGMAHIS